MHPSVEAIWVEFNTPLEGVVARPYADVKGLVTVGMGNLIDPIQLAYPLDWELPGGIKATRADVEESWRAVKNDPKAAQLGWKYSNGIPANRIRLSAMAIDKLISDKLRDNDRILLGRFPDWEERPADAQLAVHSMAWAMGPAFFRKFPKFTAAFEAKDYVTAAGQCAINPPHGTIVERNRRNRKLLLNAARNDGDPSVLLYSS